MLNKKFVIDSNVLISAAVFSSLKPAEAIKKASYLGKIAFSEVVLREYIETLMSKKFDRFVSPEKRLIFLEKFVAVSSLIHITESIAASRDTKDDKYLELAVSDNVSCIITGDKDLLVLNPFHSIPILTPHDFLNSF